jgi:energy-coupling factor transporter ATP-binding protein EcfA2
MRPVGLYSAGTHVLGRVSRERRESGEWTSSYPLGGNMPREHLITLSRAQDLAFRLSQTENVSVSGGSGSGKTVLANAMALWAVQAGASCLLVGPDSCLDRPISFRTPDGCHSILLKRTQQEPAIRGATVLPSPLEARARVSRSGLRSAQAILRRAKELLHAHALTPVEVEQSGLFGRPLSAEAADLVVVVCQDAARAADALWSGNKRAGRSIGDVLALVSKGRTEVPPDEAAAALISADDAEFDDRLASLAARSDRSAEERALAAAIAALRNPAPSDKTLIEIFRHYGWMSKAFREATELSRQYESLQAAIENGGDAPGVRIIEAFVRNRREQPASEVIRTFEAAQLRYEEDAATLEPYLPRYGLRTLESVSRSDESASAPAARVPPAEFAHRIRQARYATRRLPDLLARLHTSISSALSVWSGKATPPHTNRPTSSKPCPSRYPDSRPAATPRHGDSELRRPDAVSTARRPF